MTPQPRHCGVMGTNAALWLGEQVHQGDSRWHRTYWKAYLKMPSFVGKIMPHPAASRNPIREDAAIALAAMGSNATPGLPLMIDTLRAQDDGFSNGFYLTDCLRR